LVSLKLQHEVVSITYNENKLFEILTSNGYSETFDNVIIATPLEFSQISLVNMPTPLYRKYVDLYVTIFRGSLNKTFFRLKESEPIVNQIMQAFSEVQLLFTSVSTSHKFDDDTFLIKIFSPQEFTDENLLKMFKIEDVTKIFRKFWRPYPVLHPDPVLPDIEIVHGLFYSSAFESIGSSIECMILAARNSVLLMKSSWETETEMHTNSEKIEL